MKYLSFEKSVGGVVYRKQNGNILFLLLRYRSGQWDFSKGHAEKGESEEQTLRREVREETGIEDINILPGFRMPVRFFYIAKGNEKKEREVFGKGIYIFKKVAYYAVETKAENVGINFENRDYAWLDFDQALERIGNAGSKKVLQRVQKLLNVA